MINGLLILLGGLALLFIALGILAELRGQTVEKTLLVGGRVGRQLVVAWTRALAAHPQPALALLSSIFWLLLLIPLADHALGLRNSTTGGFIWYLVIGPHEMGHFICFPFGRFIMVAGGSIWQVLFWFLIGAYAMYLRRQVLFGLLIWYLVGHSFLDMSSYIADAQARDLPLIFNLGEESHDWYNLLRWTGLLAYDAQIAAFAVALGVIITLGCIALALLIIWFLPLSNYRGLPLRALRQAILERMTPTQPDFIDNY